MKKFREFYIKTPNNKTLRKAVLNQIKYLGYDDLGCPDWNYCVYGFESDGRTGANESKNNLAGIHGERISLDEFFALKPEDVIVEPERFRFRVIEYGEHMNNSTSYMLTRTEIMKAREFLFNLENDSPVRSVS